MRPVAFSVTGDLYKRADLIGPDYINKARRRDLTVSLRRSRRQARISQKDSDILPPYEVVDAILFRMIRGGQHREEIVNAGFDAEVVERFTRC